MKNNFDLKILDLHWMANVDETHDLCAHGHLLVKFGDAIICDKNSLDVTVSATALYLMRTIKSNYKKADFAGQLLPCCGFFMIAERENFVSICGCPNGIDWTIEHVDNDTVRHISDSGQEALIALHQYKEIVFAFADEVRSFYKNSKPKTIPEDDLDRKGYLAFWKEWEELRRQ